MKRFHCLPRNNNILNLFGNIGIEHHFPLIFPFWNSFQVIIDFPSGSTNFIYNWKIDALSAKSFTVDIKLLGRSFIYIKYSKGPKIDPYGTPVLIISPMGILAINKTLWYSLFRKLWISVSRLSETPIIFNLYIKPSCQPYQKLLTYPKIRSTFPKTESYQKIHKFHALQSKANWHIH